MHAKRYSCLSDPFCMLMDILRCIMFYRVFCWAEWPPSRFICLSTSLSFSRSEPNSRFSKFSIIFPSLKGFWCTHWSGLACKSSGSDVYAGHGWPWEVDFTRSKLWYPWVSRNVRAFFQILLHKGWWWKMVVAKYTCDPIWICICGRHDSCGSHCPSENLRVTFLWITARIEDFAFCFQCTIFGCPWIRSHVDMKGLREGHWNQEAVSPSHRAG